MPADIKSRLSSLILGDISIAIDRHLAKIDEMLQMTLRDLSFSKCAWEGRVLYQDASTEQRTSLASSYMDSVSRFQRLDGSISSMTRLILELRIPVA